MVRLSHLVLGVVPIDEVVCLIKKKMPLLLNEVTQDQSNRRTEQQKIIVVAFTETSLGMPAHQEEPTAAGLKGLTNR